MVPVNWSANVKLPIYGWFGRSGFATKQEARKFIADNYRAARRGAARSFKPSYAARSYYVRPYMLQAEG